MRYLFIIIMLIITCSCSNKVQEKSKDNNNSDSSTVMQDDAWEMKKNAGVDFVATGNDPAWELDIDLEKGITFNTSAKGINSMSFPVPEPVKSEDGNTVVYQTTIEGTGIKIVINNTPCLDDVTGEAFPYSVEIEIGGSVLNGCGKYLN